MSTRNLIRCLFITFIATGAASLRADETNQPSRGFSREQIREQLKNMTPEERRAKIKSRLEDLRKKKDQGTLTPMEQKQLDRLEIITKREQGTPSVPGPNPSSSASATTNSNAQSNQSSTKQ